MSWSPTPRSGILRWRVQLDAQMVLRIRALACSGAGTRALAHRFHVHESTIRRIVNRTTWKHLPEEATTE